MTDIETNIDQVLMSAQAALAREVTHGPLLMRSDAKDLHDFIAEYRETHRQREARAKQTFRIVEAEQGVAAFAETAGSTVAPEHVRVATTLMRLAEIDPATFTGNGRALDVVAKRIAISAVYWLAVKWISKPSWPEAARAMGLSNHSTLITRVRMAGAHMPAIRSLYDAAKAHHEMRPWEEVAEAIRVR
jgi:hypothetical protein